MIKKILLYFILGALTSLAFAPFHYWGILFFIIPIFYHTLLTAQSFKQTLLISWAFGFGYFFTGLYWISYAMRFEPDYVILLRGLALFAMPLIMSIFFLLLGGLFYALKKTCSHKFMPLLFILLWVWCEYLRTFIFTGMPWNLIAYAIDPSHRFAALSSFIGSYGLGIVILMLSFTGYFIYKNAKSFLFINLLIVFLAFFSAQKQEQQETNLAITIAQPSIDQARKIGAHDRFNILNDYIELSQTAPLDHTKTNILLWPETAIQYDLFNNELLRKQLMKELKKFDYLITGVMRVENDKYYNSLIVINKMGGIHAHYDKQHLVPFGEYIPFGKYIDLLPLAIDHEGFTPGVSDGIFTIEGYRFLPLICYEAIFPQEIIAKLSDTDFIVNISNDGWYGDTTGPHQHLDIVRMRSIETGRPVVRAANTGISAFIQSNGILTNKINLNKKETSTLNLTRPNKSDTLYSYRMSSKIERVIFNVWTGFLLVMCLIAFRRKNVRKQV